MSRLWIVVGDTTTGGGAVVTGTPFTDAYGKPVARIGDKVVCAMHGPTVIVTGDVSMVIDGQPVAREQDSCGCGCVLVSLQQRTVSIESAGADAGTSPAAVSHRAGGAGAASGRAGPASGPASGSTPGAAPQHGPQLGCPAMEIEINDTSTIDDDYVQVKSTQPARYHQVPCRIRVSAPALADTVVVLTNPDGRLRFSNAAMPTTTVTVPGSGAWVSFVISGETGSAVLNDAVIQVHCQTATGAIVVSKPVTVFWFDQEQVGAAANADYALIGGRYEVSSGNGVDLSASARIRPTGANCAAPQIAELRIGLMQNTFPPRGRRRTWTAPTITWNTGVAAGTTIMVPTTMHSTIQVTQSANDSESSVDPLYDQPGKSGTIDSGSLKPPIDCAGGGIATSNDTPRTPLAPTFFLPVKSNAAVVGTVTWSNARLVHTDNFITWAVVFNTRNKQVSALRQRAWTLNMDSDLTGQRPAPAAADAKPTTAMVTTPPYSNTRSNDPANRSSGPVSGATATFRHP